jgi:hypothetical protein
MTTYVVNHTDSSKQPILIPEESIDNSTDIALFGRTRLQYGADMNQNMLSLLERFACPESSTVPGTPNLNRSDGKLATPIEGQIWYNSTRKLPFVWNGSSWVALLSSGSIASNWGIIFDGQKIPQPIGDDGYVFQYSECVMIVGPFTMDGEIFNYDIECNQTTGVVIAQMNSGQSLVASYLIIGLRNNVNTGTNFPVVTPTMTPTISVTPSSTPQAVHLSNGLISFWEFEEAGSSSFFLDTVGTNNFTRTGSVATTLGAGPPYNNAHGVVGAGIQSGVSSFFESTPTTGMAAGVNASYTFGGWYAINPGFVSFSNLFQRGVFGTSGQRSFTLTYTLSSDSLALYKSNDGTAYEFLLTDNNIGLKDHNWHFIVAWVDAINLTLNIQVDNGTIYSQPFIFNQTYNIGTVKLGSSTGIPLQASVDQLFYYNRVLNSAERAAMYNSGKGIAASNAAGLVTPTPTPTLTPSPTPPVTPTLTALTVEPSVSMVSGSCSGTNCAATTSTVFGYVSGGVAPYTFQWTYVAGAQATVNSPTLDHTNFTRTGSAQTLTGYYRLKVTDASGYSVQSSIVQVVTTHS